MKNQVLSIEQMQELKELGIDTSKASMCWLNTTYNDRDILIPNEEVLPNKIMFDSCSYTIINCTPTFTLQDILSLIDIYQLTHNIDSCSIDVLYGGGYHIKGNTELEVAFQMLKYCKYNNYLND